MFENFKNMDWTISDYLTIITIGLSFFIPLIKRGGMSFKQVLEFEDKADRKIKKTTIVRRRKCSYFIDDARRMISYVYEMSFILLLLPYTIAMVNIYALLYTLFYNSCQNSDCGYMLLIGISIVIIVRLVYIYNRKGFEIFAYIVILALAELTFFIISIPIASKENVGAIMIILSSIGAVLLNEIVHSNILRDKRIMLFVCVKYLCLIPYFFYYAYYKNELNFVVIILWGIMTAIEYIYKLFKSYKVGEVFICVKPGEKYAINDVFQIESKVMVIDRMGIHRWLDETDVEFISYNCYRKYKNQGVHCKFVDGSIYEFSDIWIDKNKYAHIISKSGEEAYICKCEKISEWFRRK